MITSIIHVLHDLANETAGICEVDCPCSISDQRLLYLIRSSERRFFINANIYDHEAKRFETIRFLIDTGAEATIIPKYIIKDEFMFSGRKKQIKVGTIAGKDIGGFPYNASVRILASNNEGVSIKCDEMLIIKRNINIDYGILGMDILKSFIIIMQDRKMLIWDRVNYKKAGEPKHEEIPAEQGQP